MSINLMDLAKGYLGKQVMSQIGGILGESPERTESAIGGALPALIGGFMKKSSSQGGLDELLRGVNDHDDGMLDNIGDILGGGDTSGLMNAGSGILKMLFGGGLGGVMDLLMKSTGLGNKSMTGLLGMLAPIVMGVIKRQFASGGLDGPGLAGMLADQKQHIGGSLPSGFGDLLGLSSLTGAVSDAAGAVTDAAGAAAGAVTGAASQAAGAVGDASRAVAGGVGSAADSIRGATNSAAAGSGSLFGKLLPLIALVALALIAMQMFKGGGTEPADPNAPGAVGTDLETGENTELNSQIDEGVQLIEEAGSTLQGAVDEGAQVIEEGVEAVENAVGEAVDQLP